MLALKWKKQRRINLNNVTAIILAAGRGTRMQSTDTNKVAMKVHGEPLLSRSIRILRSSGISSIVVVVGFAKDSVIALLDQDILVAEQKEQLGTGHAVSCAIPFVPDTSHHLLIMNGDDSYLYTPEIFQSFYDTHVSRGAKITLITMDSDNPTGFGRIVRDKNQEIVGIVEEKNATDEQKEIQEINLGCYIIDKKYLEENIKDIKKNVVSGEFYITDIIDIISHHHGKIAGYKLTHGRWQGVNTREDLEEAENILSNE